jgi:hypothetical protein
MKPHPSQTRHVCAEVPEFERLNYFYGQLLSAADFRTEQAYAREKLKLHNRCLHGYGVICGLVVGPVAHEECCPPSHKEECDRIDADAAQIERDIQAVQEQLTSPALTSARWRELQQQLETLSGRREALRRRKENLPASQPHHDKPHEGGKVVVDCGLALDCLGNEIVLRGPVVVSLWPALKPTEQKRVKDECGTVIYLSICYCAEPTHPSRPVLPDNCGALSGCNYGKYRDSVRFRVSLDPPTADDRCELCCTPCDDECVLLAKVTWDGFSAITADDIDNSVRRPLALYRPTVITGVSWRHGGTYSQSEAKAVLGTAVDSGDRRDGIEVVFSRPVYAETLSPGVVDLWRVQGGRGLRGVISQIEGDYVGKPDAGLITSFKYRDESGETLNEGDRIIVVIRGDFILDACCRPVDGNHVGGRVPQLPAYARAATAQSAQQGTDARDVPARRDPCKEPEPCVTPPTGIGPWTSGNGTVGGTFESWFYIV